VNWFCGKSRKRVEASSGPMRVSLDSYPKWFGPVQPMIGFFIYTYSQLENSHEDGNFIRLSFYGLKLASSIAFESAFETNSGNGDR
jgi:hypothetical protein